MAENILLNSVGAITQPCLTPLVTENGCEDWPSSCNLVTMPSWNYPNKVMKLIRTAKLMHDLTAHHSWWCQKPWSGTQKWCRVWHSVLATSLAMTLQWIPYLQLNGPGPWRVDSYGLAGSFLFVEVNKWSSFTFLWDLYPIPHDLVHLPNKQWTTSCIYFC